MIGSIKIADTTREEREKIVAESIGNMYPVPRARSGAGAVTIFERGRVRYAVHILGRRVAGKHGAGGRCQGPQHG